MPVAAMPAATTGNELPSMAIRQPTIFSINTHQITDKWFHNMYPVLPEGRKAAKMAPGIRQLGNSSKHLHPMLISNNTHLIIPVRGASMLSQAPVCGNK
jgi:hypothetical protein